MFVVLLKFAENREQAAESMAAHNDWLQNGFDDGVFIMAGSLQPGLGGAIMAHDCSRDDLEQRLSSDRLVAKQIVATEILEIAPTRTVDQLNFLAG